MPGRDSGKARHRQTGLSRFPGPAPKSAQILGSDEFAGKLRGASWQPKSRKTPQQLIDDAVCRLSISRDVLLSPSRQGHLAKARAWIAHEAISLRIASLSQVARLLQRDESSLRETVQRYFSR